jgi:predicted metal-dependent hydrolase
MCDDLSTVPTRYASELPLPPYSYVSGKFPHPESDSNGHGHHRNLPHETVFDATNWRQSRLYLHAIDLFNHGYYWEAHETWESLWHLAGRRGTTADFLKGLIKLAAAGVKAREGRAEGVRRHAARAAELFANVKAVGNQANFCGLGLDNLLDFAQALQANPPTSSVAAAVEVVFDWKISLLNSEH